MLNEGQEIFLNTSLDPKIVTGNCGVGFVHEDGFLGSEIPPMITGNSIKQALDYSAKLSHRGSEGGGAGIGFNDRSKSGDRILQKLISKETQDRGDAAIDLGQDYGMIEVALSSDFEKNMSIIREFEEIMNSEEFSSQFELAYLRETPISGDDLLPFYQFYLKPKEGISFNSSTFEKLQSLLKFIKNKYDPSTQNPIINAISPENLSMIFKHTVGGKELIDTFLDFSFLSSLDGKNEPEGTILHVRFPTGTLPDPSKAHPIIFKDFTVAHNGEITNVKAIINYLRQTHDKHSVSEDELVGKSDTEILARYLQAVREILSEHSGEKITHELCLRIISQGYNQDDPMLKLAKQFGFPGVEGPFSITILTNDKTIVGRDPNGFRPYSGSNGEVIEMGDVLVKENRSREPGKPYVISEELLEKLLS